MRPLVFRTAGPADMRFVVDAWCRSYRDSYSAGVIQVDDWFSIMIPQFEKIIARPDVVVTIACLADAEPGADIAGFVVADTVETTPLIYYVFVKDHYRKGKRLGMDAGVGTQLLRTIGVDPKMPFDYVCENLLAQRLRFAGVIPLAKWKPLNGRFPKHERRTR